MKKMIIFLICLMSFTACSAAQEKKLNEKNNIENIQEPESDTVINIYEKFLNGDLKVSGIDIDCLTIPKGESDKRYLTKYAFIDSNGDRIPELHINSSRYYYVLTYIDKELKIFKDLSPYPQYYALENGGFISHRFGTAPISDEYNYFIFDAAGEERLHLCFSKYDSNNNGIYDNDDEYEFDNVKVTKKIWKGLTQRYLYTDAKGREQIRNEINWTVLYDNDTNLTALCSQEYYSKEVNHTIHTPENIREYDSCLDFPYEDMTFINEDNFLYLEEAYSNIDFFSAFERGKTELYDLYKNKFKQFLNNEGAFTDKETGGECFLYEYGYFKTYAGLQEFDLKGLIYYFFDMDEDDAPEICISDGVNFIYIFKYDPAADKIILWYEMDSTWLRLNGSKTIRWNYEGTDYAFYKLNEKGEEICAVYFFSREEYNHKINEPEVIYMSALPKYTENNKKIEITEDMKKEAYFDKGQKLFYFRVTESQYNDLTRNYFKAEKIANQNIETVSYTYDELFGEALPEL